MAVAGIGSVGTGSLVVGNKIPYIDISYPVVVLPKDIGSKKPMNTVADTIKPGLNFFEHVTKVEMKSGETNRISDGEMSELISILKGGVIYNGSSS